MKPSLTRTGFLLVGVAAVLILAGILSLTWPLFVLGFLQLGAVLVLQVLFIPYSALIRRHHLEFAWWVPVSETSGGALTAGKPLEIHLLLRNHGPLRLAIPEMRIFSSSTLDFEAKHLSTIVPSRREITLQVRATPHAAGTWFLHGLLLRLTDHFGVFMLQLYFPNLLGIKVFPKLGAIREPIPFHPRTGSSHERAGLRLLRHRGLGSDLREIRDHIPGDPFKRIAWKATARTRKLMVREYESEILVTHWLLLDISSSMRWPSPGSSKLDYGLSLCAGFSRLALEAGDRVGLITFDYRIYNQMKPGDGRPQLLRIIDRLMELHGVVDEDLTDLTDGELVAAVAEYLAHQHGISTRVPGRPPLREDPLWNHLLQGPRGELYNGQAMSEAVENLLRQRRTTAVSWWWSRVVASHPLTTRLRLFCRLSGIELPYRHTSPIMSKESGMAEALQHAAAARQSQFIVLISDLESIEDHRRVFEALKLAKHRRHTVVVVAPFSPAFLPATRDEEEEIPRRIHSLRSERQRRSIKQAIETLGIPVISATPLDALHLLMRRLSQVRMLRGGLAS